MTGTASFKVDLTRVRDKAAALRAFQAAFGFPATFGHNWDALADHLQDLTWRPADEYVLSIASGPETQNALGADWPVLLEILRETASYWSGRGKRFAVSVNGSALAPERQ